MNKVQILHLEDNETDAMLIQTILGRSDLAFEIKWVSNAERFEMALLDAKFDIVLADYSIPNYSGLAALKFTKEKYPELPFILISGTIGEEKTIELFQAGATDFITKDNLQRILPAIQRSVKDTEERNQRNKAESELIFFSKHDILTSIYNRSAFEEILTAQLIISNFQKTPLAILYLDLDNFKTVNDTFGHYVGDQLLVVVANELKNSVSDKDYVARLGGDEFVIVVPAFSGEDHITTLAANIIKRFSVPIKIADHLFKATVSIGISMAPDSGSDLKTLLQNADIALYTVKGMGGNGYKIFSNTINNAFKRRTHIENTLPYAISQNQLYIVFQPLYKLPEVEVCGVEVLLRWEHPEYGLVMPTEFIPIAEQSGLIVDIGKWVLLKSCEQFASWKAQGIKLEQIKIAVNISPTHLAQKNFFDNLLTILQTTQMSPENLELELTESAVMTSVINLDPVFEQLKSIGIKVSIDDFGVGFSSFSRLKSLPISTLKIDKSFIENLEKPSDTIIVKSIISLGHNLGLNVITEGVETKKQLELLIKYKCPMVQGFYLNPPLSFEAMTQLLSDLNAAKTKASPIE